MKWPVQRVMVVMVALVALAGSGPADAARPPVSPEAKRAAREHFGAALKHHEAGRFAEAIARYEAAWRLMPLPDLLYNIGQAHRQNGDFTRAMEHYRRYLDAAPTGAYAAVARDHVQAIEETMQRELAAKEAARAEAERRTREVARVEEVRRAREAEEEAEAERRAREAVTEERRKVRDATKTEEQRRVWDDRAAKDSPTDLPEQRSRAWLVAPVLVGVAAVAGFGAGAGLYLSAKEDNERFRMTCAPSCVPEDVLWGQNKEKAGYALLGVGGLLAVTDIVLWSVMSRRGAVERRKAWAVPVIGGVLVGGAF